MILNKNYWNKTIRKQRKASKKIPGGYLHQKYYLFICLENILNATTDKCEKKNKNRFFKIYEYIRILQTTHIHKVT